jgi:hypothetical protein
MRLTRNVPSGAGIAIVAFGLLGWSDRIASKGRSPMTIESVAARADESSEDRRAWPEVVINGRVLSGAEILQLLALYGRVPVGRFWYDPASGLWGAEGHEFSGYVQPGLPMGTLSPRASNGRTGVFLNGREINMIEALFYRWALGTVIPGRYWLDGRTGHVGLEGSPQPLFNMVVAIRRAQPSRQQGPGFWPGGVNGPDGMVGASAGNCSIVSTSAGTWSTPGC